MSHRAHFCWLDWLRFLAALMVIVGHTRYQHFSYYQHLDIPAKGAWSQALFLFPRFANEAVMIFFVLSGFLVGGRCIERSLAGTFLAKTYLIDRVTRIFVPFVPAVLISCLVSALRGEPEPIGRIIANLLCLQNIVGVPVRSNGPLWSIAYEVWFYILAFAIAMVIATKSPRTRRAVLLLAAGSFAIFTKLEAVFLFVWILGALAYFLERDPRSKGILISGTLLAAFGTIGSALTTRFTSIDVGWLAAILPSREWFLLLLGVGASLVIPTLVTLYPSRPRVVAFEALGTKLAAWSYSLYLIHAPLLDLFSHLEGNRPHQAVTATTVGLYFLKIAACLLVGWLFYLAFEKHTAAIRNRFAKKKPPSSSASAMVSPTSVS